MKRYLAVCQHMLEQLEKCSDAPGEVFEKVHFEEFIHCMGSGYFTAILAKDNGLNPEIGWIIGLLHDYYRIVMHKEMKAHGALGSEMVKKFLEEMNAFSSNEIEIITNAIRLHSYKKAIHDPYSELIKDADCFERLTSQHETIFKKSKYNRVIRIYKSFHPKKRKGD